MLKLINGGAEEASPVARGRHAETPRTVMLPPTQLSIEQMLTIGTRSASVDEACASVVESYEAANLFALGLAGFFTQHFPSASPAFESALCEVLDTATIAYLRIGPSRGPKDQLATFLASGINCAVSALTCYSTSQVRNGEYLTWEPWKDGALVDWIDWSGASLDFSPQYAPPPERRYATRAMLMQRLLRFKDVQSIARAGIDMQSLDLF